MQTSIIAPVVAFIGLIVHLIFGIQLSEGELNILTDGIVGISLLVVTIITLYKSKLKKDK